MRRASGYLIAGAIGVVALGSTIATGYVQHRVNPKPLDRAGIGSPLSERQALERRRARMAAVVVSAPAP